MCGVKEQSASRTKCSFKGVTHDSMSPASGCTWGCTWGCTCDCDCDWGLGWGWGCIRILLRLIIIICDIIAVQKAVWTWAGMLRSCSRLILDFNWEKQERDWTWRLILDLCISAQVPFQTGGACCSGSGLVPEWVCLGNVTTIGFYTPLSLAASCSMAEQFLRKSIQNCNFFSEPIQRNQFKIVIFLKTETTKTGTQVNRAESSCFFLVNNSLFHR